MSRPRVCEKRISGGLPRPGTPGRGGDPRPEWVVGACPLCGGPLVRNSYYIGGRGMVLVEECWASLSFPAACTHRRAV